MSDDIVFVADCYLKSTKLGSEGQKTVTFEFSADKALELAKLELMSRDLKNHLPVLLQMRVVQSGKEKQNRFSANLQNTRGITRKNKRLF